MRFCLGAGVFLCAFPLAIHAQSVLTDGAHSLVVDVATLNWNINKHLNVPQNNNSSDHALNFSDQSAKPQKNWQPVTVPEHSSIQSLWVSTKESGEESLQLYRKSVLPPLKKGSSLEKLSRAIPSANIRLTASYSPESTSVTLQLGSDQLQISLNETTTPIIYAGGYSLPVLMQAGVIHQMFQAMACLPLLSSGQNGFCGEGTLSWAEGRAQYISDYFQPAPAEPVLLSNDSQTISLYMEQDYQVTLKALSPYQMSISISDSGDPQDSDGGQSKSSTANGSKTSSKSVSGKIASPPSRSTSFRDQKGGSTGGAGDPRRPNGGSALKREPQDKIDFSDEKEKTPEDKKGATALTFSTDHQDLPKVAKDAIPLDVWRKTHNGQARKAKKKDSKGEKLRARAERRAQETAAQDEHERRMRELDEKDRADARKRVPNSKGKK